MRNRSNAVMIISIFIGVISIGGIIWTVNQANTKQDLRASFSRNGAPGASQIGNNSRPEGFGGRNMNIDVTTYLSSDGSVDVGQIDKMVVSFNTSRTSFLERLKTRLGSAVSANTITQDQADKILAAVKNAMDK